MADSNIIKRVYFVLAQAYLMGNLPMGNCNKNIYDKNFKSTGSDTKSKQLPDVYASNSGFVKTHGCPDCKILVCANHDPPTAFATSI